MGTTVISEDVVLRSEHLARIADGVMLVEDVSLDVRRGEILGVVGPSGAGKSSLLRLLNRLDEPTGGNVFLEGKDYRQIAPQQLRRQVGMVTQRAFLFPGTVEKNLNFGPGQRGESLSPDAVRSLLREVGLEDYAGRDVANLSGGEAQRVSLARTLANSPLVLLLDEPTSALDDESKRGIESLIQEIVFGQKLGCIMVTHDLAQATRLADRAVVLEHGRVVRSGPVKEVIHA